MTPKEIAASIERSASRTHATLMSVRADQMRIFMADYKRQSEEIERLKESKVFCAMLTTGVCELPAQLASQSELLEEARKVLEKAEQGFSVMYASRALLAKLEAKP